jgi:hypothetical protein
MKAMGYVDLKTTMIYRSLGKSTMKEQAEMRKHDPRPIDLVQAIPPVFDQAWPPEIELYAEGKDQGIAKRFTETVLQDPPSDCLLHYLLKFCYRAVRGAEESPPPPAPGPPVTSI